MALFFSRKTLVSLYLLDSLRLIFQRREHYKDFHNPSMDGKPTYYCGKCPDSSKYEFESRREFIRHLRTTVHLDEAHLCRCGKEFRREYDFRKHINTGECQGINAYTCICGYSVQSYTDAKIFASEKGHVYKCDGPRRKRGRPLGENSSTASSTKKRKRHEQKC